MASGDFLPGKTKRASVAEGDGSSAREEKKSLGALKTPSFLLRAWLAPGQDRRAAISCTQGTPSTRTPCNTHPGF